MKPLSLNGARKQLRKPDFRLAIAGTSVGCPDLLVHTSNHEIMETIVRVYEDIKQKGRAQMLANHAFGKTRLHAVNKAFNDAFKDQPDHLTQESALVIRWRVGERQGEERFTFADLCDDLVIAAVYEFVLHGAPIHALQGPPPRFSNPSNMAEIVTPTMRDQQRMGESGLVQQAH